MRQDAGAGGFKGGWCSFSTFLWLWFLWNFSQNNSKRWTSFHKYCTFSTTGTLSQSKNLLNLPLLWERGNHAIVSLCRTFLGLLGFWIPLFESNDIRFPDFFSVCSSLLLVSGFFSKSLHFVWGNNSGKFGRSKNLQVIAPPSKWTPLNHLSALNWSNN